MKDFTQSFGFIVAFLIGTIFIQMFTNKKITDGFLMLVLVSMLVMFPEKVKNLTGVMKGE